jgi:twitching motility protein PilU
MGLIDYLHKMVAAGASDLFITAGLAASAKINGEMLPIAEQVLDPEQSLALVLSAMTAKQQAQFQKDKECNFAIANDAGRFRVSAFWQRDQAGMVVRRIVTTIPKADDLGLPPVLKDIIMSKRGLVLFVGGTGAGKSTSLAALLGYRNQNARGHILTSAEKLVTSGT